MLSWSLAMSRARVCSLLLFAVACVTPSMLSAQWGQITFLSPANGTTVGSPTLAVQWKGCSQDLSQDTYSTHVGSTLFTTTQSSTVPCHDFNTPKLYSATVTLSLGDNIISAEFCNAIGSPTCIDTSIVV
jgi:hypothetical protein